MLVENELHIYWPKIGFLLFSSIQFQIVILFICVSSKNDVLSLLVIATNIVEALMIKLEGCLYEI